MHAIYIIQYNSCRKKLYLCLRYFNSAIFKILVIFWYKFAIFMQICKEFSLYGTNLHALLMLLQSCFCIFLVCKLKYFISYNLLLSNCTNCAHLTIHQHDVSWGNFIVKQVKFDQYLQQNEPPKRIFWQYQILLIQGWERESGFKNHGCHQFLGK